MSDLVLQRCFNHSMREAVARCPACSRFYCRECITEHEGKMLCATCLSQTSQTAVKRRGKIFINMLGQAVLFGSGFVLVWKFFHLLGRMLLMLPSSFHEGTVWSDIFKGLG